MPTNLMNDQMVVQMFSCVSKLIISKNSDFTEVIMVCIIKILSFKGGYSFCTQYLILYTIWQSQRDIELSRIIHLLFFLH